MIHESRLVAWVPLAVAVALTSAHLRAGPRPPRPAPADERLIETPDVVRIAGAKGARLSQELEGEHLVRPDGTVSLGRYGTVLVAGLTPAQARQAVRRHLAGWLPRDQTRCDIHVVGLAPACTVIASRPGGDRLARLALGDGATVLDVVRRAHGGELPPGSATVVIERPTPLGETRTITVDWSALVEKPRRAKKLPVRDGDVIRVRPGPDEATRRIEQLLKQSEDLRQIEAEWRRLWFRDSPSHLAPERVNGPIP